MRISAYDWVEGGTEVGDAVEIGRMLKEAGIDIVDVSSGNVTDDVRPRVEGLFQTPFSERIRNEAGIPTMTVGNVGGPQQINEVIAEAAQICAAWQRDSFTTPTSRITPPGRWISRITPGRSNIRRPAFQTGRLNRRFIIISKPRRQVLRTSTAPQCHI